MKKKISYRLPESVGGDVKIFKKIQEKLRARYDEVREFAFSEDLSEEQKKTLGEYQEALTEITPPDLMPFYREMGEGILALDRGCTEIKEEEERRYDTGWSADWRNYCGTDSVFPGEKSGIMRESERQD